MDQITTPPSTNTFTPIADLAKGFVSAVKTANPDNAGNAFKDAVEAVMSERGWEADSAARCMISSIEHASKRDMSDPSSFLAKPLKEINVGSKRLDADGQKVENTISDIAAAVSQQKVKIAAAISNGLGKLDFEH